MHTEVLMVELYDHFGVTLQGRGDGSTVADGREASMDRCGSDRLQTRVKKVKYTLLLYILYVYLF